MTRSWVVGRGGLLGRHVEQALARDPAATLWRPAEPIAWDDPDRSAAQLEQNASAFLSEAAAAAAPWRLLWCAGAGVIATSVEALARETAAARRLLGVVAARLSSEPALAARGTVFFASSAGGVYGGTETPPPHDETARPRPISPYGEAKLAQEELFARAAETCDVDLLLGRLSNLYGPGQNLSKPQGLIAHVGRAALRREPISIYVPLDTIRDYLLAEDAARMIADAVIRLESTRTAGTRRTITKIFASEVETTVASVLGAWRQAFRRPLRVALASSPVASLQPRVLSFRSRVWPDLRRQPTLLALGIDAVRRDQLARLTAPAEHGF